MNIEATVREMSLEEKAAQLLFVGFDSLTLPDRYRDWIERTGLGGLILFTRNVRTVEQTRALTASAQASATRSRQAVPLAISIDQEGGIVARLSEEAGFTHLPGNMALGAAADETLAYRSARVMAAEMRAVGINWNLAPVLDVNNNPANPVIGVRSYGADPELVARLGVAALRGFQAGGVAPCGKHFPGHGDTAVDSHRALPVIPHGLERLEAVEFVPFRVAIEAGVDSLMTAHVYFPALEPSPALPATLSANVLTGLLRNRLGYGGVIVTDCLEMKAIADNFSPEQTALLAIQAGADALLVSHTWEVQQAIFQALIEHVRAGRISEERIAQSVARVLQMKAARKMGVAFPGPVGATEHKEVALEVARRGVTVLWGSEHLPLPPRVTALLPRAVWFSQAEDSRTVMAPLLKGLQAAGITADGVDCNPDMRELSAEAIVQRAGTGGTVLIGSTGAAANPRQAEIARQLTAAGCRVIVVARRSPYDLDLFPGALAGIAAFDDSPAMQQAVAEVLAGARTAPGRLPVTIGGTST